MGGAAIDLLVLGVSHRTAPVGVRERLAVVPEAMDAVLAELKALPAVREAALLSTCNRVEIYAAVDADADRAVQGLSEALARRAGVTALELAAHLYERRDAEAVSHLFRVAASLDSLVLGEPQILGQTKQALDTAIRHKSAGAILNTCFQRAFRVAKRVRRETEIARNPVSVSSVAIELVRQVFGGFERRAVLVVGAGKMSELAARTLRNQGATLTLTNRTRARAEQLAGQYGAAVRDWSELPAALGAADIVIASTGAQRPVLTLEMMQKVQRARRGRPLFLLDIAVPRDVEPEVGSLDGIYLADIDDLQKVAAEHRDERKSEADGAEAIVAQELDRFLKAWRGRQLGPTVTALRAHVLGVAQAEAARVLAANPGLGERERKLVGDLAESLAKKLLHTPQMALRNDDADGVPLVVAVQRLFALEVAAPAPLEGDAEEGAAPAATAPAVGEMKDKKAAGR
jgi:glutamyl-tRNA reductase